ncbi:hypothetical protein MKW92_001120 [Papaver armeniacum]|nr:hypothetical protein MKW92_001120 [Papaver armeniacum]
MCTKFSEIADRVAANDDEYSAMNDWLIETMNSLKIVDSSSTNHYFMAKQEEEAEEDNDDEDDTDEEEEEACIKDPSRKKRKGRPRSLRLKAHRKRSAAEKLQAIAESEIQNKNATEATIKQWGVYGQILVIVFMP